MPERRLWTKQQDILLKKLKQQKELKWSSIARELSTQFNLESRTGKQCRERYYNFLDSSINRQQWTPQQQKLLFDLHNQYGNKWALISKKITGRSDNCVKNHFYSKLRKSIRRINRITQYILKKQYKQIKNQIIYKILQTSESKYKISSKINQEDEEFSTNLINKIYLFDSQSPLLTKNDQMEAEIIYKDILHFEKGVKKNKNKFLNQPCDDFYLHPKSCLKLKRASSHQSSLNLSQYDSNSQNSDVYSTQSANFLDSSFQSGSVNHSMTNQSQIKINFQDQQQNSTMIKDSQTTKKSSFYDLKNPDNSATECQKLLQVPTNFLNLSNKSVKSDNRSGKELFNSVKSQQNLGSYFLTNNQKQMITPKVQNNFLLKPKINQNVNLNLNNQFNINQYYMDQQFNYHYDQNERVNEQNCQFFEDIKIQFRIISPKVSQKSSMSFDSNKDFCLQ